MRKYASVAVTLRKTSSDRGQAIGSLTAHPRLSASRSYAIFIRGGTVRIKDIRARELLDSRGNPTLEVEVELVVVVVVVEVVVAVVVVLSLFVCFVLFVCLLACFVCFLFFCKVFIHKLVLKKL